MGALELFPLSDYFMCVVDPEPEDVQAIISGAERILDYISVLRTRTRIEDLAGLNGPGALLSQSSVRTLFNNYTSTLECFLGVCHALSNAVIPGVIRVFLYFDLGTRVEAAVRMPPEVIEDYHGRRAVVFELLQGLARVFSQCIEDTYCLSDATLMLAQAIPAPDRKHLRVLLPAVAPVEWVSSGCFRWMGTIFASHGRYSLRGALWSYRQAPYWGPIQWDYAEKPLAWERPTAWPCYELSKPDNFTRHVLEELLPKIPGKYFSMVTEESLLQAAKYSSAYCERVPTKLRDWQLDPTEAAKARSKAVFNANYQLEKAQYLGLKVVADAQQLPRPTAAVADRQQPAAAAASCVAEEVQQSTAITARTPTLGVLAGGDHQERYDGNSLYDYEGYFRVALPVTGKPALQFAGKGLVDGALVALQQGAVSMAMVLLRSILGQSDGPCWEEAGTLMLHQLRGVNQLIMAVTMFQHSPVPCGAPQGMVCAKHHLCGHPGSGCEPLTAYTSSGGLREPDAAIRAARVRGLAQADNFHPDLEWLFRPRSDFSPAWLTMMGAASTLFPADQHSILLLVLAAIDVALNHTAGNCGDDADQLRAVLHCHKEEWQKLAAIWAVNPSIEERGAAAAVGVNEPGDKGSLFVAPNALWDKKQRAAVGLHAASLSASQVADYYRLHTRCLGNPLTVGGDPATPCRSLQPPLYPKDRRAQEWSRKKAKQV